MHHNRRVNKFKIIFRTLRLQHEFLKFQNPWLSLTTLLPALLNMAARKKSKTQPTDSESEAEFGIYNVERIVAKKIDSKVIIFICLYYLLFRSFLNRNFIFRERYSI